MPMQLRGLRTFCLASRLLSFKKAADELCLSASAVSHQISDLEEELGVRLFERLTRSIEMTSQGRQFYEQVQPCLEAIDGAAQKLRANGQRVPLLVQLPEFFASELLMPIISGFSEQHQNIDLRIESMETSDQVDPNADINIVLTRKTPVAAQLEKLFPIHYIPACSKSLYEEWEGKDISNTDAIHMSTMLLHKARPHAWVRWARHAGLGDIKPRQIIYVDSMFALARAAQQGAGIALVPMPVSKSWFDSGALVPLHDASLLTEDYYWMTMSRKPSNSAAANTFWKWMVDNFQEHRISMNKLSSSVP